MVRRLRSAAVLAALLVSPASWAADAPMSRPAPSGGIVLLDAPSNLGLRPPRPGAEPGVKGLADAIRATGLADRLGARDMGRVGPPAYSPDDEPVTGFRNGLALADFSRQLAVRMSAALETGQRVIVLGGDCSVLLGTGLALRKRGHYGLAFIDAHDDFSPPRHPEEFRGHMTAAGRDLALATGTGPDQLTDIDGLRPYFRRADVVQIGLSRADDDRTYFETERYDGSGIPTFDVASVSSRGAQQVARDARRILESTRTDGFWIHVDADVLDQTLMPAVDSPNPHGMTFEQLDVVLTELLASPKAAGLELTIFDPSLDPDGHLARRLAGVIEHAVENARHVPKFRK